MKQIWQGSIEARRDQPSVGGGLSLGFRFIAHTLLANFLAITFKKKACNFFIHICRILDMFRHDQLGVGGGSSFGLHLWDRAHPLPANFLENFSEFASGGFKHTSSIQYSENSQLWLTFMQPCRSAACKFPSKLVSLYVNRISDCLDLLNKKTDAQWIVCLVLSTSKHTTQQWVELCFGWAFFSPENISFFVDDMNRGFILCSKFTNFPVGVK